MKATRSPREEDKLLRLMWEDISRDPSDAPGLTQLIRCLTKAYYERKHLPQMPERKTLMFYITGLAIEQALLGSRQRPVAGVLDGVSFHTDHVIEAEGEFYEIKSTRTSMDKDFDQLSPTWHRQVLGYFKATGRTRGLYGILHLMGNYKPPFPDLVVYEVEATNQEIEDNWKWIQERLRVLTEHEKKSEPPEPYKYRIYDWGGSDKEYECEDCPYAILCKMKSEGLM